ncbi:MAG: lactonase family protein [Chitinophagaceae bacterium]|nr:lactonase family protein [Chitinophagaceae bacterium]
MKKIQTALGALLLSLITMTVVAQTQSTYYLLAGTYTGGKSEGIYVYEFNTKDGSFKEISHVKTSNPSYLAVSPDDRFVFSVAENGKNNSGGEVCSFSFNKQNGALKEINRQPSGGASPCYVQADATGKWVAVANYSSGTFSVLPVNPSGQLGNPFTIKHTGSSVDKIRQSRPYVHSTLFSRDNKYLFVQDLGIDKIMIYDFNGSTGKVTPSARPFQKIHDGGGPRHLTFHPNNRYAYLIEEMGGAVDAFQYHNGRFSLIQRIPSVQTNDTGFVGSADIHVSKDGAFLYASNRGGFNTIAIYKINPSDGTLQLAGHQPSLGGFPRGFTIDPTDKYLLAANQNSDNTVIFERNKQTGLLTDTGKRIEVGKPVCLKWINRD